MAGDTTPSRTPVPAYSDHMAHLADTSTVTSPREVYHPAQVIPRANFDPPNVAFYTGITCGPWYTCCAPATADVSARCATLI